MRRSLIVASCLAAITVAGQANANGRYPAAGQIAVHPKDPTHIMVRATYGLLFTSTTGKSWGWICEPAVGFGNNEDPAVAFTADGTPLAGIFEGLAAGTSDACQWSVLAGDLTNKYVIDLAIDKVDPTQGVLIVSNSVGQDDAGQPVFLTQLWQTADSGKTWTQAGTNLPSEFLGLTVDTAPSNPQRVYMSGRYGAPDYLGAIERSDDRGTTWQKLPIPGTDSMHLPYLGGVDPNDPDVIYVRIVTGTADSLVVSKDGGMTWSTAFTGQGPLEGFAISPDGSTIALGSPGLLTDGGTRTGLGLWTAPSSSMSFTQASNVGAECLTWTTSGLYACADEFVSGFTAGISQDQGKSFTPIMHLQDPCGPLTCGPTTSVGSQCATLWPNVQTTIGSMCGMGDAGTSSSSSSGGGPTPTKSGCSCSLPGGETGSVAVLSLAGLAAALGGARRARRRPRTRS